MLPRSMVPVLRVIRLPAVIDPVGIMFATLHHPLTGLGFAMNMADDHRAEYLGYSDRHEMREREAETLWADALGLPTTLLMRLYPSSGGGGPGESPSSTKPPSLQETGTEWQKIEQEFAADPYEGELLSPDSHLTPKGSKPRDRCPARFLGRYGVTSHRCVLPRGHRGKHRFPKKG